MPCARMSHQARVLSALRSFDAFALCCGMLRSHQLSLPRSAGSYPCARLIALRLSLERIKIKSFIRLHCFRLVVSIDLNRQIRAATTRAGIVKARERAVMLKAYLTS